MISVISKKPIIPIIVWTNRERMGFRLIQQVQVLPVLYKSTTMDNGEQCVLIIGITGKWMMPRLHVDNLVSQKLWDIGTLDKGRGKYGWTTWDVLGQRPHLGAVLTMDGEMLSLTAPHTNMMLVYILANV
jgi:hypothetical protein